MLAAPLLSLLELARLGLFVQSPSSAASPRQMGGLVPDARAALEEIAAAVSDSRRSIDSR